MSGRVVVIGAGLVGHRFVDELAATGIDREIHLIGAEEYEPYNRILLSDVLAGRTELSAITLPRPVESVRVHRGIAAVALDRTSRRVLLADGTELGYDQVVLATGASAVVPPIPGLTPAPRHVHVLRTLDDCRDLTARALNAKHAVVLGGGLLGLEAACALRRRGVAVTVIDVAERLLPAQLDPAASAALTHAVGALGVDVRTDAQVTDVVSAYDEVVAVRLGDGTVLATDLLLLSCGIRPVTALAADAGLEVRRGIVVDGGGATSDPRVFALGDCAEPPEGVSGLLAPGWAQAGRLAAALAGTDRCVSPGLAPDARSAPVRLKAVGVDLVTMGLAASAASATDRVVTLSDPSAGRHVELVLREDALVGVTCVGRPELAPELTLTYELGTALPGDPLALLVPAAAAAPASTPVHMPNATTVCRCNTVTKQDIVEAWEAGAQSVPEVAARTRATTGCGGCTEVVCGLVDWLNHSDPASSQPAPVTPAVAVSQP